MCRRVDGARDVGRPVWLWFWFRFGLAAGFLLWLLVQCILQESWLVWAVVGLLVHGRESAKVEVGYDEVVVGVGWSVVWG